MMQTKMEIGSEQKKARTYSCDNCNKEIPKIIITEFKDGNRKWCEFGLCAECAAELEKNLKEKREEL